MLRHHQAAQNAGAQPQESQVGEMNTTHVDVRRLGVVDAGLLVALRKQALDSEPLAFGASPKDDVASRLEAASQLLAAVDTQAAFGYMDADRLGGAVGVFRVGTAKQAHKAIVWGMF